MPRAPWSADPALLPRKGGEDEEGTPAATYEHRASRDAAPAARRRAQNSEKKYSRYLATGNLKRLANPPFPKVLYNQGFAIRSRGSGTKTLLGPSCAPMHEECQEETHGWTQGASSPFRRLLVVRSRRRGVLVVLVVWSRRLKATVVILVVLVVLVVPRRRRRGC